MLSLIHISIFPIELNQEYLAHRHGFLAGTPGVQISVALQQSFRGGIFGGEGFLLQKIGGTGQAWIELSGEVMVYDLQPGQVMRVHPGHVGLFQASVNFSVIRVPGVANRYFGADGHHWVVLTGPGRVWLQSLSLIHIYPQREQPPEPAADHDDPVGRAAGHDPGAIASRVRAG